MRYPNQDRALRRAELWLRWWTVIQFLFLAAACVACCGIVVMLLLTLFGIKSRQELHDDFVWTVIVFGICMLLTTLTTWPVARLKRRVSALTYESKG